jgi:glycine oxidase
MPSTVAIAGAGIIGASIAWRLAQQGVQVVLVDAGTMGAEASSAGAGMLAPGSEVASSSAWSGLALESHSAYSAFVADLTSETGLEIDYRVSGALELAHDQSQWRQIQQRAAVQRNLGIPSESLTPKQAAARIPSLNPQRLAGAIFYPNDAIVDPRHIMRCLRQAILSRRVRLMENCRVAAIHCGRAGLRLQLDGGHSLISDTAVIAAGAWSGRIPVLTGANEQPKPDTFPVRGHLVAYHLPPNTLAPILRQGHTYLLQRSDGRLIAGTSQEQAGFDRTIDPGAVRDIHLRASQLLPETLPNAPDESWIGFRPATPDFIPQIRRLDNTPVWIAYGHFRNGILLAPATAARITREILSS